MMRSFGIIFVLLFIGCAVGQDRCTTPTRKQGTCISIKQCKPLLDVLTGPKPLPTASLDLLRSSKCGYQGNTPKVCCEQQIQQTTTPSNVPEAPVDVDSPPPAPNVIDHQNLKLLDHAKCGPITQQKIYGGKKTGVFDFPWMALIGYDVGEGKKEFRCGGSILNKRYILTAAHCVTSLSKEIKLSGVRVGDHDLTTERDCDKDGGVEIVCSERYQDFGIESHHFHPKYSRLRLQNDIALIRVDADIDFRPTSVKPICMPVGPAAKTNLKRVTVTGWGATENNSLNSTELLQVTLLPVPLTTCAETYRGFSEITHKQICAGGRNGMDSCGGDSGGPMQAPGMYNNQPRYIQFGVVSYGLSSCGTEGWPGVYTRVDYYLDWVLDTIRE